MITTGASTDAISSIWALLLNDARAEVEDRASLYVYGSVATGMAVPPRSAAATRWDELEPDAGVGQLVVWLGDPPDDAHDVRRALQGTVATIERTFAEEIGLWPD